MIEMCCEISDQMNPGAEIPMGDKFLYCCVEDLVEQSESSDS